MSSSRLSDSPAKIGKKNMESRHFKMAEAVHEIRDLDSK